MKLPKLPKLPSLKSLHLPSRITMERLLIVSAAALVVVLAVRGGHRDQRGRSGGHGAGLVEHDRVDLAGLLENLWAADQNPHL